MNRPLANPEARAACIRVYVDIAARKAERAYAGTRARDLRVT